MNMFVWMDDVCGYVWMYDWMVGCTFVRTYVKHMDGCMPTYI